METIDCIFCKNSNLSFYKSENGYQAVQCDNCGLVFTNPRPSIDELKDMYQRMETKVDIEKHIQTFDLKTVQARKSLSFIKEYCSKGKILEIGSAAGYFLLEARNQGFDATGIDIVKQFVNYSRDVLGLNVKEMKILDLDFEENTFDVIFLRNVLSHLANPIEEFMVLHRILKPGGIIVLETGNVSELPPEKAGELELPEHLFHFSEENINKLFEKSGFINLKTRRFTLLSRLPAIETIERLINVFSALASKKSSKDKKSELKTSTKNRESGYTLPRLSKLKRINASIGQFIRYDIGGMIPSKKYRCTLISIARKESLDFSKLK